MNATETTTRHSKSPLAIAHAADSLSAWRICHALLSRIRQPLNSTTYAYDPNGNLVQVTDSSTGSLQAPGGQIKRYTYDAANRRIREDHYPSATALAANNAVKSITYTYNTLDRLTGYADGTTIGTYTYDTKQLRQTGESVNYAPTGPAPAGFTLATGTSYNALGQKSGITYPDGATYSYTYDSNNQLSAVNLPAGFGNITFNSYLWTVPAQITMPGGTARNQTYDGLLRLKTLAVKDPGQSQVMGYQYGYDLTGNIVAKATEQGTTNYSYDALDRLTGASYTGSTGSPQANEGYTYDPVANRITDSKTATATWTYNANNQLITAGTTTYTYDDNGNTASQTDSANAANTKNYAYDTDNRLVEVRDSSNALIAAYSYDPFGRRLSKDTGNSKTYYFYSAEGLIAEADASGQITKSYGYAPGSTFVTNPLWLKTNNIAGTPAYYTYQNDHLGTPMKLLNQSGQTVWSATYDAFGKATVDAASTVTNNLRFPGQYEDAETNLHYNWQRYYSAKEGRYIESDPIGLRGGINGYTYVYGNPLMWSDPYGLWCVDQATVDGIAGAFGGAVGGAIGGIGTGPWGIIGGALGGGVLGYGAGYAGSGAGPWGNAAAGVPGAVGGALGAGGPGPSGRGLAGAAIGGALSNVAASGAQGNMPNAWGGLIGGGLGGALGNSLPGGKFSPVRGGLGGGLGGFVGGFAQDAMNSFLAPHIRH